MFEKIGRAAEKAADGVSRRDFLGRFGKAALATAAVLGGVLALPGGAQAGHRTFYTCCLIPNRCGALGYCPPPSGPCTAVSLTCSGCVWRCGNKIVTTGCGYQIGC